MKRTQAWEWLCENEGGTRGLGKSWEVDAPLWIHRPSQKASLTCCCGFTSVSRPHYASWEGGDKSGPFLQWESTKYLLSASPGLSDPQWFTVHSGKRQAMGHRHPVWLTRMRTKLWAQKQRREGGSGVQLEETRRLWKDSHPVLCWPG